jgi:hypothetical protein
VGGQGAHTRHHAGDSARAKPAIAHMVVLDPHPHATVACAEAGDSIVFIAEVDRDKVAAWSSVTDLEEMPF